MNYVVKLKQHYMWSLTLKTLLSYIVTLCVSTKTHKTFGYKLFFIYWTFSHPSVLEDHDIIDLVARHYGKDGSSKVSDVWFWTWSVKDPVLLTTPSQPCDNPQLQMQEQLSQTCPRSTAGTDTSVFWYLSHAKHRNSCRAQETENREDSSCMSCFWQLLLLC